jgi:hypothetical protein
MIQYMPEPSIAPFVLGVIACNSKETGTRTAQMLAELSDGVATALYETTGLRVLCGGYDGKGTYCHLTISEIAAQLLLQDSPRSPDRGLFETLPIPRVKGAVLAELQSLDPNSRDLSETVKGLLSGSQEKVHCALGASGNPFTQITDPGCFITSFLVHLGGRALNSSVKGLTVGRNVCSLTETFGAWLSGIPQNVLHTEGVVLSHWTKRAVDKMDFSRFKLLRYSQSRSCSWVYGLG